MKQTNYERDNFGPMLDEQSGQRTEGSTCNAGDYRCTVLGAFIGSLIGVLTVNGFIALFESGGFNSLLLGLAAMFFGGLIDHLFYNS